MCIRDSAEDDRQHETLLERERLAGTGQREQSHRQRVGEEHRSIEMAEQPAEVEHERADGDADEDEIGVRGEVPVSYTHLDVYKRQGSCRC